MVWFIVWHKNFKIWNNFKKRFNFTYQENISIGFQAVWKWKSWVFKNIYTHFLKEPAKLGPRLAKSFKVFNVFCSYFFPIFFQIFHNTVMIYNIRNWVMIQQNIRKKKELFQCSFSVQSVKKSRIIKMCLLGTRCGHSKA